MPSAAARVAVAFDYGNRRIGAACGDTISCTASPLEAIANGPGGPHWESVTRVLRDWQPALIVVGLPYNVDGTESKIAERVRRFAQELAQRYALPVELVDERYSSREAEARLKSQRESGLRRRRVEKSDVDAGAAVVILERWFNEAT